MQFGDKIRAARQAADMTQQILADKVGVSRRTIALYETNKRKPKNAGTIITLASHRIAERVTELAERYERTMPELETEAAKLESKVKSHLERMGFVW